MDDNVTRRGLLTGACAALALGVTSAALAAAPEVAAAPSGTKVRITVASTALKKVGGVVTTRVNGVSVGVVRTGTSTFVAVRLVCPHAGAPVSKTSTGWYCYAHGSSFAKSGARVSGPTPRGLSTVPTSYSAGVLTVG